MNKLAETGVTQKGKEQVKVESNPDFIFTSHRILGMVLTLGFIFFSQLKNEDNYHIYLRELL